MNKLKTLAINFVISYLGVFVVEEILNKIASPDYLYTQKGMLWFHYLEMKTFERFFKVWPWFFECLGEQEPIMGLTGLFFAFDIFIILYVAYWLTYIRNTTKETNL